jgi:hypothetical protein
MLQAGDFTTADIAVAQFPHSAFHAKSSVVWPMSRMVHARTNMLHENNVNFRLILV